MLQDGNSHHWLELKAATFEERAQVGSARRPVPLIPLSQMFSGFLVEKSPFQNWRCMNLWGDLFCRLLLFRRTCFPGTQMKKSMAESKIWRDWLTWMSRGCCTISEEDIRWTIFMWVFIEWICWYLCGQLGFFHVLSPYLLMMRWTWDYSCVIVLCDIENV